MPLRSMVIKAAGTNSVAGGTDMTFAPDGITIPNGVHLIVPAVSDFLVRPQLTVKYRPPALSNGKYGKAKLSMSFTIPSILADGSMNFDVLRLEREVHPETAAAVALDFNNIGAQLLYDPDVTNFWATGDLN